MQAMAQSIDWPGSKMASQGEVDITLEDLKIEKVLAGDEEAWSELMAEVHPLAIQLCRYRLRCADEEQEELCRDVASKTLERLRKANFAALRRYAETRQEYPNLRFRTWLRAVVGNVCIDHLRTLPGHSRVREGGARRHKITATRVLTQEPASKSDTQRQVEIRRVLAWLCDPTFPEKQREAISLWVLGYDAAEIATKMELAAAADATRLLRAGRQRLRRRFEEPQP